MIPENISPGLAANYMQVPSLSPVAQTSQLESIAETMNIDNESPGIDKQSSIGNSATMRPKFPAGARVIETSFDQNVTSALSVPASPTNRADSQTKNMREVLGSRERLEEWGESGLYD